MTSPTTSAPSLSSRLRARRASTIGAGSRRGRRGRVEGPRPSTIPGEAASRSRPSVLTESTRKRTLGPGRRGRPTSFAKGPASDGRPAQGLSELGRPRPPGPSIRGSTTGVPLAIPGATGPGRSGLDKDRPDTTDRSTGGSPITPTTLRIRGIGKHRFGRRPVAETSSLARPWRSHSTEPHRRRATPRSKSGSFA